jgi:hypothetical protein
MTKNIKRLSYIIIFTIFVIQAKVINATSLMDGVSSNCVSEGSCQLNDVGLLAINISRWILGIVGSLSLLAFVYGGVLWLISGGNRETVQKGRQVMIGAVIGLAIVFSSYLIISFVLNAIGSSYADKWMKLP